MRPALRTAARAAFALAVVGVGALALAPAARLPPLAFSWWDKAQHALAFAVLALLGRLAVPRRGGALALALLAYGALIELAQHATGYRHGDVADALADAVGVALGLALARISTRGTAAAASRPRP